jgi:hypothetical protein
MRSELGEYAAALDAAWQLPAVTVDEFIARDLRHRLIGRNPEQREELEAELAADRATVEAAMEPGDELRPWLYRFDAVGPSGCKGVAVVWAGRVVKAWWTASLC